MNCPLDKAPLIGIEFDLIELDYCTVCKGIWLDPGELELLFGDAEACREFLGGSPDRHGAPTVVEKARRCPLCEARMPKLMLGGAPPVIVDRCPAGHGLWLDGGELESLLRQGAGPGRAAQVATFLGGLLGKTEGAAE
jgi:Zn-finger nucleic acid-binding protein